MQALAIYHDKDIAITQTVHGDSAAHVALIEVERGSQHAENILQAAPSIVAQHLVVDDLCLHRCVLQQMLRARASHHHLIQHTRQFLLTLVLNDALCHKRRRKAEHSCCQQILWFHYNHNTPYLFLKSGHRPLPGGSVHSSCNNIWQVFWLTPSLPGLPICARQTVTLAVARHLFGDYSCRNSSGLSRGFPCTCMDRTIQISKSGCKGTAFICIYQDLW